MKVFGVIGHSGMGKTTLLERLLPELCSRGLVVSLIKHSHKNIDIDRPGKDSYRLRESGCKEVLLLGNDRWALMHELRGAAEPPLDYLLERLQHCDLVLIEGFKDGGFPKLEVWRAALGKPLLWPDWPGIVAIASDTPVTASAGPPCGSGCAALALPDTASIAPLPCRTPPSGAEFAAPSEAHAKIRLFDQRGACRGLESEDRDYRRAERRDRRLDRHARPGQR